MRRLLAIISLIAPLLLSTACQLFSDPQSPADVTLALSGTEVSQAAPVAVTVTIVNRTGHSVETPDPRHYACVPPYIVRDSAGKQVDLPGRYCLAILYAPVTLAPGDSVTVHDHWAADRGDSGSISLPVTAGRYIISPLVYVDGREQTGTGVEVLVTTATSAQRSP